MKKTRGTKGKTMKIHDPFVGLPNMEGTSGPRCETPEDSSGLGHKRRYRVVRVVVGFDLSTSSWWHRADVRGLVRLFSLVHTITIHRDDEAGLCFDILPPAPLSERQEERWCRDIADEAQRMMVNAVVAPKVME